MVETLKRRLREGLRIRGMRELGLSAGVLVALFSFQQSAMRDVNAQLQNLETKMSQVLVTKEDRETGQLRATYLERDTDALEKQLNEVKAELHEHGDKLSEIEVKLSAILTTLGRDNRHASNP